MLFLKIGPIRVQRKSEFLAMDINKWNGEIQNINVGTVEDAIQNVRSCNEYNCVRCRALARIPVSS